MMRSRWHRSKITRRIGRRSELSDESVQEVNQDDVTMSTLRGRTSSTSFVSSIESRVRHGKSSKIKRMASVERRLFCGFPALITDADVTIFLLISNYGYPRY